MFLGRKIIPKAKYGLETEREKIIITNTAKLKIKQEKVLATPKKKRKITSNTKVEVAINEQKSPL